MNQKESTFTFIGNVVAKQKDSTLYANKLIVFNDSNTKRLKEVVAVGNVKVVQLERRATSQKATFYQEENKVVFDGEVVIWEGENIIRGERVTYYIDEDRSVVEGKKGGQVSTHITPTQKEEKK
jgi:lipopolysaccharide export system protein LptA